jgi:hypothetical protein
MYKERTIQEPNVPNHQQARGPSFIQENFLGINRAMIPPQNIMLVYTRWGNNGSWDSKITGWLQVVRLTYQDYKRRNKKVTPAAELLSPTGDNVFLAFFFI